MKIFQLLLISSSMTLALACDQGGGGGPTTSALQDPSGGEETWDDLGLVPECAPAYWPSEAYTFRCDTQEARDTLNSCLAVIHTCGDPAYPDSCDKAHECYPEYHSLACVCAATSCALSRQRGLDDGSCLECVDACQDVDSSWDAEDGPGEYTQMRMTYASYRYLCGA